MPQPFTPDINLNDVIDAIRQTDPGTFQNFQPGNQPAEAMAMTMSYPPARSHQGKAAADTSAKSKKQAYVKITEQPASKGLRFRYECEGRSAGSIPGVSSTNDRKTHPTIQVVGYKGRAVVVVSAVTAEQPYRPHPHNLVGKEGCSKGVCTIEMDSETMTCGFPTLGIQCVKKKEIEESLILRQQIRVDPFQTGFVHKDNPQSIDLNCVRLCFQVFLEGADRGAFTFALKPVVSDPIYDKKAKNDLTICKMTECSAPVTGGKEILLFCEKVSKDDIEVRFFQEKGGLILWEGFGDFQPSDVHKQYGISFKTPRYRDLEIEENVQVQVQLRRPSDKAVSDPRNFDFTPIELTSLAAKRRKTNYSVFNTILSCDQLNRNVDDQLRRKRASSSSLMSPDSTLMVQSSPSDPSKGQITQPIQLVHASTFPPPPSPVKTPAVSSTVTCATPDLPPPPTPLLQTLEEVKPPPKAATMNLHPLNDLKDEAMDEAYDEVIPCVYDDVDIKYDGMEFTPLPPVRKKPTVGVNTVPPCTTASLEEPTKPLPETPSKKPSLISKLKPKGKQPKVSKDEAPGENGNRPSASIFQRLFLRSKSVTSAEVSVKDPPLPPPHRDDNGNEDVIDDTQIKELQDFFDDQGNMENIDSMVNDFANEYLKDEEGNNQVDENNANLLQSP